MFLQTLNHSLRPLLAINMRSRLPLGGPKRVNRARRLFYQDNSSNIIFILHMLFISTLFDIIWLTFESKWVPIRCFNIGLIIAPLVPIWLLLVIPRVSTILQYLSKHDSALISMKFHIFTNILFRLLHCPNLAFMLLTGQECIQPFNPCFSIILIGHN